MRSRLFVAAAVLRLALAAGAGSAWALIPEEMAVKIPFDFIVGKMTMPAGEYTFSNPDLSAQDLIEIRSADGLKSVFVQTTPISPKGNEYVEQSKLDFRKIDGKEYLACIWAAGTDGGNAIPRSQLPANIERAAPQGK